MIDMKKYLWRDYELRTDYRMCIILVIVVGIVRTTLLFIKCTFYLLCAFVFIVTRNNNIYDIHIYT